MVVRRNGRADIKRARGLDLAYEFSNSLYRIFNRHNFLHRGLFVRNLCTGWRC